MRISGKSGSIGSTQGVSGASRSAPVSGVAPSGPAAPSDAVTVSGAARLVTVAHEVLATVPDIRADKVEALKTQIDADTYHPDGKVVAEGLIREHLAPGRRS